MFIERLISKHQKQRAIELAGEKVYNRSMRGKEANLVGAYGEVIVFDHLRSIGLEPKFVHKTTHDIEVAGYTLDVKTKERTVEPKPYYDCTVPAYNHSHQRPNYFVFVSLLSDKSKSKDRFSKGWILGKINYDRLEKSCTKWSAGDIDPDNGWQVTIDCYNISASNLTPVKLSNNDESKLEKAS